MAFLQIQSQSSQRSDLLEGSNLSAKAIALDLANRQRRSTLSPSLAEFTGFGFLTKACKDCISAAPPGCNVSNTPSRSAICPHGLCLITLFKDILLELSRNTPYQQQHQPVFVLRVLW